ncbi:MAG: cell wall metabolism sensor histidine kinase WalK [Defluviitaleaceae bacterium]|nr:cell wall metabolism sensor histidine kinase WalK [Defluviitaleaceae bacterium]
MKVRRFNSIKLKLMVIYISVVLIVMVLSGTFMLRQVRSMEEERARERLRGFAVQAYNTIVQPNDRSRFMDAPEWETLQSEYDIEVILMSELGIGIAPAGFVGARSNDRAISWAMSGQEGFSVGRVGMDLNDIEAEWLSFAMPVDHPDGRFIINTRMKTDDMNANLFELTRILLLTVLVALIIIPIAWYFLANTITRPIVAMSRHARAVAGGDLSKKIPVHSRDEIGVLANSVNYMTDEIVQHLEQKEKQDNMRKEFVANVSHELRTPLTSIRTYTETLIDGALEDPKTAIAFLEIIDEEARRMTTLVTDLLELSRLDNKQTTLELDIVDLLGLIRITIRQCQVLAEQKNQEIKLGGTEEACFILANAPRVNQVISNILSNAIKYSPEGSTVHVVVESDESRHTVSIRDEGMGVPEEDLARIFDRFYRVDKARSRALGGTGLGLAIAKEIMEAHGGAIHASSTPGEGTTMVLRFKREEGGMSHEGDESGDNSPTFQRVKYV